MHRRWYAKHTSGWVRRHRKDVYVKRAHTEKWRSRAAFKLLELDEKLCLFRRGSRVLDLGGAPGGWAQVAARGVAAGEDDGGQPIDTIPGVMTVQGDFTTEKVIHLAAASLRGGVADVVLSDAAPNASGDKQLDHIRTIALCESALLVACTMSLLAPGGHCIVKATRGGQEGDLKDFMKSMFTEVRFMKPSASRGESREIYLCGLQHVPIA